MLSLFKCDFADVTRGYNVIKQILQHDMGEDVAAIVDGVAVGDVENLANAKIVPNCIWELREVGCGR